MGIFAKGGLTLYFPGPLASAKLPHVVAATRSLLTDMGVSFVMAEGMETSGFHAWVAGYEELFQEIKGRNEAWLRQQKVKHIITNDPHEAYTFRERYGIEAQHLLEVCVGQAEKIRKGETRKASYHHACFLDRLGVEEKEAARLLRRAGIHISTENKGEGCCGSVGDDFARNNKEAAELVVKARAKELPEKLVVTACPYCHLMLKRQGLAVKDVAELLGEER